MAELTESINSKYALFYWAKIFGSIVLGIGVILLFFQRDLKSTDQASLNNTHLIVFGLIILVPIIVITMLFPPTRVTVSAENILFYSYVSRKKDIIRYPDIDKLRTVRVQRFIKGGTGINYQQFEITLKNKDVFTFDEDEYANYDALKAAIYDHMR